jgi:hypothetical protein
MALLQNIRITPQFSGGALTSAERRKCIMEWRACGATAMPYHRPLQLLVRRLAQRFCHVYLQVIVLCESGAFDKY